MALAVITQVAGLGADPRRQEPVEGLEISVERVIVTRRDLGGGAILRRLTGKPETPLFKRPYGVAWEGDALLVTDPESGRVLRIPAQGKKKAKSSPQGLLLSPMGVATCTAGIVVTDSRIGGVALLDADLRLVRWLARDLQRPSGVACTEEQIYVAETASHRILILGPGDQRTTMGARGTDLGQFNFPAALALDGDSLWVGDTLNFRLQRISLVSGEVIESFGQLGDAPGEMPRIKGLAVDVDGHLWISDAYLDQIALYNRSGVFLSGLIQSGSEVGEFSFPAGLAAHSDGSIAVVDSLNRRIQILRLVDGGKRVSE
jgi:DNA-binding beta-propeller fold protein YncE